VHEFIVPARFWEDHVERDLLQDAESTAVRKGKNYLVRLTDADVGELYGDAEHYFQSGVKEYGREMQGVIASAKATMARIEQQFTPKQIAQFRDPEDQLAAERRRYVKAVEADKAYAAKKAAEAATAAEREASKVQFRASEAAKKRAERDAYWGVDPTPAPETVTMPAIPEPVTVAEQLATPGVKIPKAVTPEAALRARIRAEAAQISRDAYEQLDHFEATQLRLPPAKGAQSGAGRLLRGGEYDFLERIDPKELKRLRRNNWLNTTTTTYPDHVLESMNLKGLELNQDEAMGKWLELTRTADAAQIVAKTGKLPSMDLYGGTSLDLSTFAPQAAAEGYDIERILTGTGVADHMAEVEGATAKSHALGYLDRAVDGIHGPRPYELSAESFAGEVATIEHAMDNNLATVAQRARYDELVPRYIDAPGMTSDELHAAITQHAKTAGLPTYTPPVEFPVAPLTALEEQMAAPSKALARIPATSTALSPLPTHAPISIAPAAESVVGAIGQEATMPLSIGPGNAAGSLIPFRPQLPVQSLLEQQFGNGVGAIGSGGAAGPINIGNIGYAPGAANAANAAGSVAASAGPATSAAQSVASQLGGNPFTTPGAAANAAGGATQAAKYGRLGTFLARTPFSNIGGSAGRAGLSGLTAAGGALGPGSIGRSLGYGLAGQLASGALRAGLGGEKDGNWDNFAEDALSYGGTGAGIASMIPIPGVSTAAGFVAGVTVAGLKNFLFGGGSDSPKTEAAKLVKTQDTDLNKILANAGLSSEATQQIRLQLLAGNQGVTDKAQITAAYDQVRGMIPALAQEETSQRRQLSGTLAAQQMLMPKFDAYLQSMGADQKAFAAANQQYASQVGASNPLMGALITKQGARSVLSNDATAAAYRSQLNSQVAAQAGQIGAPQSIMDDLIKQYG
jgi:hypothetical protein